MLADGTVVSSLNKMLKNNAGYDLKQVFIDSEGTLGVITQAVLRLQARPVAIDSAFCACPDFEAVLKLLQQPRRQFGVSLTSFEVMGIVDGKVNAAGGKGRPAETVDMVPDGLCSIAVLIRADRVSADLVDARGNQVESRKLPVTDRTDYAEAVSLIGNAVLDLSEQASARFRCLAGVGVSFGGSADYPTGSITVRRQH